MGAALREQGHEVRLIPAQSVKPCRKSTKNHFIDGEAIAEAVTKQNMLWLPKTLSVSTCPCDQVKGRFIGAEWGTFPESLPPE